MTTAPLVEPAPPAAKSLRPLELHPPQSAPGDLGTMVSGLVGSEILKIAAEVRGLKQAGRPICDLTVGDFGPAQFHIPAALGQAVGRALAAGETNYPPSDGVMRLRQAVQAFYERALGLSYPLDGILIAGGARPLIYGVFRSVLDPGDRVVYSVPSWNNNHYAHLCGAVGVAVTTRAEDGFLPTADLLRPHLRGARLLSLNSPLNPAGTGFERGQLAAIAEAVVEENLRRGGPGSTERPLYLLYDQIYWMLAADSAPHWTPVDLVPEVARYTVFVDGISKSFAATGLRVGWACGPPYLVSRLRDFIGHVGAWAPRPEQIATAEILDARGARAVANELRAGLLDRLSAVYQGLVQMGVDGLPVGALPPAGALYLSARFDLNGRLGTNESIRKHLLDRAGFAVVPFQAFGLAEDSGWFRLSVGAVGIDDIASALPRVREAVRELVA